MVRNWDDDEAISDFRGEGWWMGVLVFYYNDRSLFSRSLGIFGMDC
jgi:hypothetical protein